MLLRRRQNLYIYITVLLECCGEVTVIKAFSYVIYLELEINFHKATRKDRESCFSLLAEAVATSAIRFIM